MSKKILLPLLALLISANGSLAQERIDEAMFERIRDEGLNRSQVWEMYGYLVDVIGPRLTGTPAFRESADWARDKLMSWGLSSARLEPFDFGRGWTLEGFSIEMRKPRYMPLIGYPQAWSPSTRGEIVAGPVMLGDKSVEELAAFEGKLAGAIVLTRPISTRFILDDRQAPDPIPPRGFAPEEQPQQQSARRALSQLTRNEGVGVTLQPSRGAHGTMFVLGRDNGDDAAPSVVVADEHYNMIARLLERGIEVEIAVEVKSMFHEEDTNGYNVIAEIPGTDPILKDEIVMVGGHLDSWHSSPGGTDNADANASILEAARILQTLGVRPRRTIRIALWGGEEEGLLGSRAWVAENLEGDENQEARDNFSVYFNIDPGAGPVYGFFMEENNGVVPFFEACLRPFADLCDVGNTIEPIGSTDHVPFKQLGLPAFTAINDYVDYDVRTHHTNMDTYERIREADLRQCAVVTAALIYQAAMRDGMMPRKPPED
jgi:hypothetical protein